MPASRRFVAKRKRVPLALLLFIFCGCVLWGWSEVSAQSVQTEIQPKTRPAPTVDSDVAQWTTLKNIYGWEIKYPKNWHVIGEGVGSNSGDSSPNTSDLVFIKGPGSCSGESERCGTVEVAPQDQMHSFMSLEEFLGVSNAPPPPGFSRPRRFELSESSALEYCWLMARIPACHVAIEHKGGQIFDIQYSEFGNDHSQIKSPKDWQYESIFNKIVKTFSFYQIPKTLWPED